MSKSQRLRVLVTERLTAAAEEILSLFERTMAEYEEELRRSQNENQRKQRFLDALLNHVLRPRAGAGVQGPSSPGPGLSQDIPETAEVKEEPEEPRVKQEPEQLPQFVPESSAVSVTEESSLLQTQTEHREETQEEDVSSEPHFLSETEGDTDNDDDWERPLSSSEAQMDTDDDGDLYNQPQTRDGSTAAHQSPEYRSAPETGATVNNGDMSRTDERAERKKHQCSVCNKRFIHNESLQIHMRVHTGEKPYSCSICDKPFNQKSNLKVHIRIHTNGKPYSCLFCDKTFNQKGNLQIHMRVHTGERPYSCSMCDKTFNQQSSLKRHMRIHTNERPYSCTICGKTFNQKSQVQNHMKKHFPV